MKPALREIQHFGITVRRRSRSGRFYFRVLRLPLLAETVNRGAQCDAMYRLRESVNHVSWYQIGDGGIETFCLPRHPSPKSNVSDIRAPGYRYLAFFADGIDDFAGRLVGEGLDVAWIQSEAGRCFRIKDPDGIHLLFFDSGRGARIGDVSAPREIGLVAADPEGYEEFFDTIGLEKIEDDTDYIKGFFGLDAPAPLYGNVRLICLPGAVHPVPKRCFPSTSAEPAAPFSDVGIKHIAHYVDDVQEFYRYGKERGVCFLFEPVKVKGGSRITYFLDPEGNTFEAMEVSRPARMAAVAAGNARKFQMDIQSTALGLFNRL